ncbi:hypothetical protein Acr_04g0006740 [Actinidia rufa]|uniref:Uncharacterized protein n=1 Tax=Actinidia rufa TaxID=165716 RepID=A0A7J0EIB3_9ERIC|nr:hypothetical protein Acr_04g0006740 [Actinidia rufa]
MFSGLIPGLNSAITLEDELSSQIPAIWISLLDLTNRLPSIEAYAGTNSTLFSQAVAFFRRKLSEISVPLECRTLVPCLYFGLFVTIAVIALSQYSEDGGRGRRRRRRRRKAWGRFFQSDGRRFAGSGSGGGGLRLHGSLQSW